MSKKEDSPSLGSSQRSLDIFRLISERVPEKNPPDARGWTPLHDAASEGHTEICRALLKVVENKSPLTNKGETPLQLAEARSRKEVCHLINSYLMK